MSDTDILCLQDGAILTLQINRLGKKNALTHAMYSQLAQALKDADANDSVRCVIITGSPDCFTSGNDLGDFMSNPPASFEEAPVAGFLYQLQDFSKPLIAAVGGIAIGIGTTLLLHCDLIYAADNTRFQMPFVNLGLCPEGGSSYLLPRLLGHPRAAELLLLGRTFSADEALAWGLINGVASTEETLTKARDVALQIAAQPPAAVRLSKKLLKQSQYATLRETLAREGLNFFGQLQSAEAKEAFAAFAEKRRPDFSRFS